MNHSWIVKLRKCYFYNRYVDIDEIYNDDEIYNVMRSIIDT